jgi:hypothetical protein
MSKIAKVEGHKDLIRDLHSNAIVNTNTTEYSLYLQRRKLREKNNDILRDTVKEINSLKSELFEIKKLLKEVINK